MFGSLSEKLQATFKRLRSKGKLTEADVTEAMREIRMALLEADVNFRVVKDLIAKIKERAIGQEVMESLTPGQQVIKIVHEEIISLMGDKESKLTVASKPPTVILLVGLQGAGKTTQAAKLANLLKKQGKRPLLVAGDIYRPAAIKQLQVLGKQIEVPVFSENKASPVEIATQSLEHACQHGNDTLIIDTAGRLHVNEELMTELSEIKTKVSPHEILLVVDAMTGQDAVNVAEAFHNQLGLSGVILSKLDGDTRGGAALSVKAVTGCPIKLVGVGEKIDALEVFHPDRIASRILGMGDVLTLIEKAQQSFDEKKAREIEEKIRRQELTLDDFLEQIRQLRRMGPLSSVLDMIPGLGKQLKGVQIDEKEFYKAEAIICSMTKEEREKPSIIKDSRKKRIAKGSGTTVVDVGRLLKQHEQMKKMMKQFSGVPGIGGGAGSSKRRKGKKGKKGSSRKKSLAKFPFPF
ncbi:MAG: signal recognition particle protein [Desulfitobacteriia bacterium]|jgi:signal recognition particle subunit SRP54